MSQSSGKKEFTFPGSIEGKYGDSSQRSTPHFDFPSEPNSQILSPMSNFPLLAHYKRENEGPKKRLYGSLEDLKENNPIDALDGYNSPKFAKFDDCFKTKPPAAMSLENLLKEKGQEVKLMFAKRSNEFGELESFEKMVPVRIDQLLKDALSREENFKRQKEKLDNNLRDLTRAWKKD